MASSASAPSFPSTKETINYARLCRLLVDVGTQVLRYTFDAIHSPEELHTVLNRNPEHADLQSLRKKGILNPTQWGKLYPATSSPVSSADFDITLLMVLLRNICGLVPPNTGWDNLPPAADMSKEANIARLKYYRNTVYGHASQASVDDAKFNSYWQDISNAIVGLGGADYGAAIGKLKIESLDPDKEEHYRQQLKEDMREMQENIRGDIKQLRKEFGKVSEKVDFLTTQQDETNRPGDAGIAALAESLGRNNSLKRLDLSGNNIGDAGARALAECLRDNKSLTKLCLSSNGISDDGAVALAQYLKGNASLEKLDLSRNNIADAGAAALADCLRDNTTLTTLKLSDNNIGSVGVAALANCFQGRATLMDYDSSQ
ncbi:NLR family CARD domain-containing protein 3-like [Stylophora pistillata]|nr:NLR family CARD domain-containing protein 3-like [Stylophora pistillata]